MSSSISLAVPRLHAATAPAAAAWNLVDLNELVVAEAEPEVDEAELEMLRQMEAEAAAAFEAEQEAVRLFEEDQRRLRAEYDRGFEEGRREGEMAEEARLRTAVAAAEDALEELRLGEMRWTGTIEENVCALAVLIARQVIGRELAMDAEPVLDLVRNALTEFPIDQPIRIRVNPTDLAAISRPAADGRDPLLGVTRDRDARWLPDAAIARGGCIVEGRERIIDGRVDIALERIYRRLTYTNA